MQLEFWTPVPTLTRTQWILGRSRSVFAFFFYDGMLRSSCSSIKIFEDGLCDTLRCSAPQWCMHRARPSHSKPSLDSNFIFFVSLMFCPNCTNNIQFESL
jgi:hypothetical protein